jgi:Domain of unknown function (DUF6458)
MGLGIGIFLVAIGAILAFAINPVHTSGVVDVHTVGYILLVVGAVGIALSMAFWSSWGGPGSFSRHRSSTYVDGAGGRVSRRDVIDEM